MEEVPTSDSYRKVSSSGLQYDAVFGDEFKCRAQEHARCELIARIGARNEEVDGSV